jgi:hypothetical protein
MKNIMYLFPLFLLLCCVSIWCEDNKVIGDADMSSSPKLTIVSPAFKLGSPIPKKYTGDGPDVSPPLNWDGIPDGTKSLALISDDPDAPVGTWVHWVIFNIPPTEKGLLKGFPNKIVWQMVRDKGQMISEKLGIMVLHHHRVNRIDIILSYTHWI